MGTSVSLTVTSSDEQVYQLLANANPELVCLALHTVGRMRHMDQERAIIAVKAVLDEHSLSFSPKVHLAAAAVLAKIATRNDGKGIDTLNTLVRSARKVSLAFLQHASEELKADKELVLCAVQLNGLALQYASRQLQADQDIVIAAVAENSLAFQFAAVRLKSNRDFVL